MYSGRIAATAYRQIQGKSYPTVVVISPSHLEHFEYTSVFTGTAYETPLGQVEVDRETVEIIGAAGVDTVRIVASGHLHSPEHSLEVHLPFLQVALKDFRLVAAVMGRQDEQACRVLGQVLGDVLTDSGGLIVASTDLSHFHTQKTAEGLDGRVIERINRFDPVGLLADVAEHDCEACGAGPVAAAMFAARELGAETAENLEYATSGDVSGDFSQVVGYTAGIIYR
jgi:hypothetical protein